ncbi:hypothetical protein OIU76_001753 [Salix suchowensis]|uniref:Uncharacterized protein n=1 Tax=Salix suchowensis TaxID=1278906 RepID=A0ABQ9CJG1_9ROSI|nr:hypothetical protein OIU76_001753 [Salix suchowensis]KAJ6399104.1 hypothetical protein OIU77_019784 [Salix suchowensis]
MVKVLVIYVVRRCCYAMQCFVTLNCGIGGKKYWTVFMCWQVLTVGQNIWWWYLFVAQLVLLQNICSHV